MVAGLLRSNVAGRTDRLPMSVEQDSYVIPADVVSGAGQGNTEAGATILNQVLGLDRPGMKAGGRPSVDIIAAGGEFIVPAEVVSRLGKGDSKAGHRLLDKMVENIRQHTIKRMVKLPKPKR